VRKIKNQFGRVFGRAEKLTLLTPALYVLGSEVFMKKTVVVLLGLVLAQSAFAASLNLSSGESAVIEANTRTVVSCNGASEGTSPATCESAVAGFRLTLEYCYKSYNGGYCAEKYWPKFKQQNPSCISAGAGPCVEYCYKSYNGGYCAEKCQ